MKKIVLVSDVSTFTLKFHRYNRNDFNFEMFRAFSNCNIADNHCYGYVLLLKRLQIYSTSNGVIRLNIFYNAAYKAFLS